MPPETRAIVELQAFTSDGFGTIATMEETFDGRQIPIPFELEADSFTGSPAAFELRAGLELDGHIIRVGEEDFTLRQVPAASGVRYESTDDPSASLFNKGTRVEVTVRGETLPECTINTAPTGSIRATGNEPPWMAITEGDQMTLITEYGERTQPLPVLNAHQGASLTRYRAAGDELAVLLNIRSEVCNDSMTGMPHPYSAALASPQGVLHGCAGQPLARDTVFAAIMIVF